MVRFAVGSEFLQQACQFRVRRLKADFSLTLLPSSKSEQYEQRFVRGALIAAFPDVERIEFQYLEVWRNRYR